MMRPPPGCTPGQSRATSALQYFIASACWASALDRGGHESRERKRRGDCELTDAHVSPPFAAQGRTVDGGQIGRAHLAVK